jgi:hypothetical protein
MSVNPEQLAKLMSQVAILEARIAHLEDIKDVEDCVRLEKWCTITGDTKDAVYSRKRDGKWAEGIHCIMRDGRLWVNYSEAMKWLKKNPITSRPV